MGKKMIDPDPSIRSTPMPSSSNSFPFPRVSSIWLENSFTSSIALLAEILHFLAIKLASTLCPESSLNLNLMVLEGGVIVPVALSICAGLLTNSKVPILGSATCCFEKSNSCM